MSFEWPSADPLPPIGSYPVSVDADYVIELLAQLSGREDPYEGPLPHSIARFTRYELAEVPIEQLLAADLQYGAMLAAEYAGMDASTRPPCVFDPLDGILLDGNHRAQGARINGESTVLCYVGVLDSIDANWSEWSE